MDFAEGWVRRGSTSVTGNTDQAPGLIGLLVRVARWRYPILICWVGYWCAIQLTSRGGDWHYFLQGSDLLVGHHPAGTPSGGLHTYAHYPELQIGPLSFLATWGVRLISPGDGHQTVQLLMCALGPLLVYGVERSAVRLRGLGRAGDDPLILLTVLGGGLIFLKAWIDVAGAAAHLDDVLILAMAVTAVWGVAHKRPLLVGLAIGVAIAAKPWGVLLVPLAFALPRPRWLPSLGLAGALGGLMWLPFVLGDTGTISAAGRFAIGIDPESGLQALGVGPGMTPHWLRPLQLGVALLLGLLAVKLRRWEGAVLVAIAVRVALDPGVFPYYAAGLILAALIWDLAGSRRAIPIWTLLSFVALDQLGAAVVDAQARGIVRLALAGLIVLAVLAGPHRARSPSSGSKSPAAVLAS